MARNSLAPTNHILFNRISALYMGSASLETTNYHYILNAYSSIGLKAAIMEKGSVESDPPRIDLLKRMGYLFGPHSISNIQGSYLDIQSLVDLTPRKWCRSSGHCSSSNSESDSLVGKQCDQTECLNVCVTMSVYWSTKWYSNSTS